MKNLLKKASIKINQIKTNAIELLKDDKGISETTEKLLWTLGAVVIVGIILAWAIPFFKDTALPELGKRILDVLKLG